MSAVGVYGYLNIGHISMTKTYTVKTEFNPSNSVLDTFQKPSVMIVLRLVKGRLDQCSINRRSYGTITFGD